MRIRLAFLAAALGLAACDQPAEQTAEARIAAMRAMPANPAPTYPLTTGCLASGALTYTCATP